MSDKITLDPQSRSQLEEDYEYLTYTLETEISKLIPYMRDRQTITSEEAEDCEVSN